MNQDNSIKQIEKEMKYKQFFNEYSRLMDERGKMHLSQVSEPEAKKKIELESWIAKNQKEYEENQQRYHEALGLFKKQNQMNMNVVNAEKIEYKNMQDDEYKRSYPLRAQENYQLMQASKEYYDKLREERQNEQKMYNDILKRQQAVKNDILNNYGTMTQNEKRLNKGVLQHYKEADGRIDALIPGIYNISSIGSKPTCRGGKIIVNDTLNLNNFKDIKAGFTGILIRSKNSKKSNSIYGKCL